MAEGKGSGLKAASTKSLVLAPMKGLEFLHVYYSKDISKQCFLFFFSLMEHDLKPVNMLIIMLTDIPGPHNLNVWRGL